MQFALQLFLCVGELSRLRDSSLSLLVNLLPFLVYTRYMSLLINWIVSALVILVVSYLLPGVHVQDFLTALAVALVLGVINAIIKPIVIILTLPINILTLGLFTFVINAFLILLVSALVPGFSVNGFFAALLFSIVLGIANFCVHVLAG